MVMRTMKTRRNRRTVSWVVVLGDNELCRASENVQYLTLRDEIYTGQQIDVNFVFLVHTISHWTL